MKEVKVDGTTLAAFLAIVLFLGVNFVAVRFSNRELEPFWGAALRFAISSLVLFGAVFALHLQLPRGSALIGSILFGSLAFGISFALLYWGLVSVPAAMASVVFSTIPLSTLLLAVGVRLEKFHWRGIAGSIITLAGIGIIFREQLSSNVPFVPLLTVFGAAISAAASGIVVKRMKKSHPIGVNAIAMTVGTLILLLASALAGEEARLPTLNQTFVAITWLVASSTIAFVLIVWVILRWTASAASYSSVLSPIVTFVVASWLGGEVITPIFLAGSFVVLVGVYTGAIAPK